MSSLWKNTNNLTNFQWASCMPDSPSCRGPIGWSIPNFRVLLMSSFIVTPMMAFMVSSHAGQDNWVCVYLVDEQYHYSTWNETWYVLGCRDLCHAVVELEHNDWDITLSTSNSMSFCSFKCWLQGSQGSNQSHKFLQNFCWFFEWKYGKGCREYHDRHRIEECKPAEGG